MDGYDHENKNTFKAIGVNEKEAASSWNEFILEYLPIMAKSNLEVRIRFIESWIAKKDNRLTAFCFVRIISASMNFGAAKTINDIILGFASLIIREDDKRIECSEDVKSFFNKLGFSEKAVVALVGKAENFKKGLADLSPISKRVETMEQFVSEKALSNTQKAIVVYIVVLAGLNAMLELDDIGNAFFKAMFESIGAEAEEEKVPGESEGGGGGTVH